MATIEELRALVRQRREALQEAEDQLREALIEASPFKVGDLVSRTSSRGYGGTRKTVTSVYRVARLIPRYGSVEVVGNMLRADGTFGEATHTVYSPVKLTPEEIAALNIKGGN